MSTKKWTKIARINAVTFIQNLERYKDFTGCCRNTVFMMYIRISTKNDHDDILSFYFGSANLEKPRKIAIFKNHSLVCMLLTYITQRKTLCTLFSVSLIV